MFASYPDLHLEIHSEDQLSMKLYDQRDYFNIPNMHFSFICSNITSISLSWYDIPEVAVPVIL
jgi:hypothetical protein